MWTDNDRNMSHFFMKAYSNFAKYGYVSSNADLLYDKMKKYNYFILF